MPNPLVPSISNNQVSWSALLNNPTRLNVFVARLAADMLIADAIFTPAGNTVQGGALLFDVMLHGSNYSVRDIAQRSPGAEYQITYSDPKRDLATPVDWGSKVQILDEERSRFDPVVLQNRIISLANTISRKIDQLALATVEAALSKYSIASVTGHNWQTLTTVGPLTAITASTARPTADIANAALLARTDDLGYKAPDTLVCHPQEQTSLRIGYGYELPQVLAAVGIENVRTSMQVTPGTAYVCPQGVAGLIGFEATPYGATNLGQPGVGIGSGGQAGLVTEILPDRETRSTWLQSYCVPAFAVVVPGAIRKITGLAG